MSKELTIKVESFRKIPNPYLNKEDGNKDAMMYVAICDVKIYQKIFLWKQIPENRN